jgi:hypothetical protein
MKVLEAREAGTRRLFQLDVARVLAAQLIQVDAFMHSRGVIMEASSIATTMFRTFC